MSSEPDALRAAEPAGVVAPAKPPILRGHLHPAVLILRLLDALRQSALLVVFGLIADRWFLVAGLALFLVHLGVGLIRYLTFQYVLTEAELVTRVGILNRQERRIPIDRVQDLGFESTILRRVLRLAVVRVETASGEGAEAELDSLARGDAEHLREVLLGLRARRVAAGARGADAPRAPGAGGEPEWAIHRVDAGMLLLRGMSDLRAGAIVVTGFTALQVADQLGLAAQARGVGSSLFDWLAGFPMLFGALVLAGLVVAVAGFSTALSALGNLVMFHGFQLSLRADSLLVRYGLLTTRQKTLPRVRIQRLRIEQNWLRRLLGVAVARADSAGSGRGTGEEAPGGFDVVVPLAPLPHIEALLPAVLSGLVGPTPPRRASPRLVLRVFAKGGLWLLAGTALLLPLFGPIALCTLFALPIPWLLGRLAWLNLGWALWPRHLLLSFGVLGRYQVLVPTAKVQAMALQRGPLQRLLGLCDLLVFVAGGPPTRLPDLALAEARPLLAELARRATAAAVRDWHDLRV